jgi:opacity protein-like surface antigen
MKPPASEPLEGGAIVKTTAVLSVLLLTLCIAATAGAQVNIGFLGGVNIANVSLDPEIEGVEVSSRTAFGFGGVFEYGFGEFISVQVEPMYLQKGADRKVTYPSEVPGEMCVCESEFRATYLEIPVMIRYAFGGDIQPYVMAGPTIGFLLSSEEEWTEDGESGTTDMKDESKSVEFGLGFGGGVRVPVGNYQAFVEARYGLGLTKVNDPAADSMDPSADTDVKTRNIEIFAGIVFPLGAP